MPFEAKFFNLSSNKYKLSILEPNTNKIINTIDILQLEYNSIICEFPLLKILIKNISQPPEELAFSLPKQDLYTIDQDFPNPITIVKNTTNNEKFYGEKIKISPLPATLSVQVPETGSTFHKNFITKYASNEKNSEFSSSNMSYSSFNFNNNNKANCPKQDVINAEKPTLSDCNSTTYSSALKPINIFPQQKLDNSTSTISSSGVNNTVIHNQYSTTNLNRNYINNNSYTNSYNNNNTYENLIGSSKRPKNNNINFITNYNTNINTSLSTESLNLVTSSSNNNKNISNKIIYNNSNFENKPNTATEAYLTSAGNKTDFYQANILAGINSNISSKANLKFSETNNLMNDSKSADLTNNFHVIFDAKKFVDDAIKQKSTLSYNYQSTNAADSGFDSFVKADKDFTQKEFQIPNPSNYNISSSNINNYYTSNIDNTTSGIYYNSNSNTDKNIYLPNLSANESEKKYNSNTADYPYLFLSLNKEKADTNLDKLSYSVAANNYQDSKLQNSSDYLLANKTYATIGEQNERKTANIYPKSQITINYNPSTFISRQNNKQNITVINENQIKIVSGKNNFSKYNMQTEVQTKAQMSKVSLYNQDVSKITDNKNTNMISNLDINYNIGDISNINNEGYARRSKSVHEQEHKKTLSSSETLLSKQNKGFNDTILFDKAQNHYNNFNTNSQYIYSNGNGNGYNNATVNNNCFVPKINATDSNIVSSKLNIIPPLSARETTNNMTKSFYNDSYFKYNNLNSNEKTIYYNQNTNHSNLSNRDHNNFNFSNYTQKINFNNNNKLVCANKSTMLNEPASSNFQRHNYPVENNKENQKSFSQTISKSVVTRVNYNPGNTLNIHHENKKIIFNNLRELETSKVKDNTEEMKETGQVKKIEKNLTDKQYSLLNLNKCDSSIHLEKSEDTKEDKHNKKKRKSSFEIILLQDIISTNNNNHNDDNIDNKNINKSQNEKFSIHSNDENKSIQIEEEKQIIDSSVNGVGINEGKNKSEKKLLKTKSLVEEILENKSFLIKKPDEVVKSDDSLSDNSQILITGNMVELQEKLNMLKQNRQDNEAIDYINQAIYSYPENKKLYKTKLLLLFDLKSNKEALDFYKEILQLFEKDFPLFVNKIKLEVLLRLEKYNQALQVVDQLINIKKKNANLFLRKIQIMKSNKNVKADQIIEFIYQCIANFPEQQTFYIERHNFLHSLENNAEDALKAWTICITKEPEDIECYKKKIKFLQMLKNWDELLLFYETCAENFVDYKKEFCEQKLNCLQNLQRLEEAQSYAIKNSLISEAFATKSVEIINQEQDEKLEEQGFINEKKELPFEIKVSEKLEFSVDLKQEDQYLEIVQVNINNNQTCEENINVINVANDNDIVADFNIVIEYAKEEIIGVKHTIDKQENEIKKESNNSLSTPLNNSQAICDNNNISIIQECDKNEEIIENELSTIPVTACAVIQDENPNKNLDATDIDKKEDVFIASSHENHTKEVNYQILSELLSPQRDLEQNKISENVVISTSNNCEVIEVSDSIQIIKAESIGRKLSKENKSLTNEEVSKDNNIEENVLTYNYENLLENNQNVTSNDISEMINADNHGNQALEMSASVDNSNTNIVEKTCIFEENKKVKESTLVLNSSHINTEPKKIYKTIELKLEIIKSNQTIESYREHKSHRENNEINTNIQSSIINSESKSQIRAEIAATEQVQENFEAFLNSASNKANILLQDNFCSFKLLINKHYEKIYTAKEKIKMKNKGCFTRKVSVKEYSLTNKGEEELQMLKHYINLIDNHITMNIDNEHENIENIYGYYFTTEKFYLISEFYKGEDLNYLLQYRNCKFSYKQKLSVAIQVANALYFLHSLETPIVHNNVLSSSVIFVENMHDANVESFTAKLTDLGFSKYLSHDASEKNDNSVGILIDNRPSEPLNSFSSEALLGEKASTKTDVYFFGILLFEIFTGKITFRKIRDIKDAIFYKQKEFDFEKIMSNLKDEVENLIPDSTPKSLTELISLCWEKEPQKRPDIAQIKEMLEQMYTEY